MHLDKISMPLPILYIKGNTGRNVLFMMHFCHLLLMFENSVDSDEMQL